MDVRRVRALKVVSGFGALANLDLQQDATHGRVVTPLARAFCTPQLSTELAYLRGREMPRPTAACRCGAARVQFASQGTLCGECSCVDCCELSLAWSCARPCLTRGFFADQKKSWHFANRADVEIPERFFVSAPP